VSNRPNYSRRRRERRAVATALPVVRAVYGCRCDLEVRHRDHLAHIGHDDGCPLIGRAQYVIDLGGHR
jgi:hypothetical protein